MQHLDRFLLIFVFSKFDSRFLYQRLLLLRPKSKVLNLHLWYLHFEKCQKFLVLSRVIRNNLKLKQKRIYLILKNVSASCICTFLLELKTTKSASFDAENIKHYLCLCFNDGRGEFRNFLSKEFIPVLSCTSLSGGNLHGNMLQFVFFTYFKTKV